MTLPASGQSISSAAIRILAPIWTGLRPLSRPRPGTALMYRIPFTFSTANAQPFDQIAGQPVINKERVIAISLVVAVESYAFLPAINIH